MSHRTHAAPPVAGGQRISQLNDVFLSLAGTQLQLIEAGRRFFELRVVLVDLAQCRVVLVLADTPSIEVLAQVLDLLVEFGHSCPGWIDCPQQTVQGLLFIQRRLC
ncbi:hypothetical protein D3C86_1103150 [compost metagenome]